MPLRPPAAGECNTRGVIQRPPAVPTRDESGEPADEWVSVGVFYAKLEPLQGRELWQARQVQSETTHTLWVRYSSELASLSPTWRFVTDAGRVIEFGPALRDRENRPAWWVIEGRERTT